MTYLSVANLHFSFSYVYLIYLRTLILPLSKDLYFSSMFLESNLLLVLNCLQIYCLPLNGFIEETADIGLLILLCDPLSTLISTVLIAVNRFIVYLYHDEVLLSKSLFDLFYKLSHA